MKDKVFLCAGNNLTAIYRDPKKGNCVVASVAIGVGKLIAKCPVTLVRRGDIKQGCELDNYPMWWTNRVDCLAFGVINLLNHSDNPNVRLVRNYRKRSISCIAKRDIHPGEELAIDYDCKLWFKVQP